MSKVLFHALKKYKQGLDSFLESFSKNVEYEKLISEMMTWIHVPSGLCGGKAKKQCQILSVLPLNLLNSTK